MKIHSDFNLYKLNTFGISVNAKFFVEIQSENDVKQLFDAPEFKNNKKLFLGGGSNVLFTEDFDGLVILNKLKGIKILKEHTDSENVEIHAMGGEIWHDLVVFAVERELWGIENLSLIPGTVGAAPMQNIGAYGAELQDVLKNVEAFNISTGEKKIFSKKECLLGYRDSIFKNELKDEYFITAITLVLSKVPKINVSYKVLQEYLEKNKIKVNNSRDISEAVSAIRKSKLPDPTDIPNAGSFFRNVFVEKDKIKELLEVYPDMPYFEEVSEEGGREGVVKISAAWLIEQAGWKGRKKGNVGVHDRQALVLVNHGQASGGEVLTLANQIIIDVRNKFGLTLLLEVNLV